MPHLFYYEQQQTPTQMTIYGLIALLLYGVNYLADMVCSLWLRSGEPLFLQDTSGTLNNQRSCNREREMFVRDCKWTNYSD